jgi:hypothetical protein
MKTAMNELIDYIQSNEIVYNYDLIIKLKELLNKEKEQIIDAYLSGSGYDCDEEIVIANEFYNQTYKNENF